jgi:cytochrome c-type biogenesis protein
VSPDSIPALISFAAGVLSFLSPCQLAVLPAFVAHLSDVPTAAKPTRWRTVGRAVGFVGGFSTSFVALGASVGLFGYLLYDALPHLRQLGGAIVILFGLHQLGVVRLPLLYREARLSAPKPAGGYFASWLLGVVFGFGWTPCIGPTLGGILLLASATQTVSQGAALLAVYSAGLGLPYIAVAFALASTSRKLPLIGRHARLVTMASGALLCTLGLPPMLDRFSLLAGLLGTWAPGI